MELLTLAVAAAASGLIIVLKPRHGLGVLFALYMGYPSYLAASAGSVDFKAGRIAAIVLLLRALLDRETRATLRRTTINILVVASFAWGTFALMLTEGAKVLENRAGACIDVLFPYLAASIIVRTRKDLATLAKWAAFIVIAAGGLGAIESLTGFSPYSGLAQYCPWWSKTGVAAPRWGLTRASGALGVHIVFGMCFVALLPLALTLREEAGRWKAWGILGASAAVTGVFSSLSSGPLGGLMVFAACAALLYRPKLVRPVLAGLFIFIVMVEIGSNRHFYDLIGYVTFSASTAWYRARLIEVAVRELPSYWLLGNGLGDPGWGPLIDGRSFTDGCNQYVIAALRSGLPGVALFVGAMAAALARLRNAYRTSAAPAVRKSAWYMGSMVIAFGLVLWSVNLQGALEPVFYTLLGVAAAPVFDAARDAASGRRRGSFGAWQTQGGGQPDDLPCERRGGSGQKETPPGPRATGGRT